MNIKFLFIAFSLLICGNSFANDKTVIRLGVQATGTVDWELSVIQAQANTDFKIEIRHLANTEAGKIAMQSDAVDMIVSDWIWVSKQRAAGTDLTFYPYSTTAGALVVPETSPIHTIKDLKGKRLGIAGGELDKNWLLLQALAQQEKFDLDKSVEKVFGAPPLLNQQIKQEKVDALLTYWHFAAQLEAHGFRQVLDGKDILQGLEINEAVPTVGYVFRQNWAERHKQAVNNFLKASVQAKRDLCNSDQAWQKVIPLTKAEDSVTEAKLRQRYCQGQIQTWGKPEQQAAERIYGLLRNLSNNKLTGEDEHLQAGTFWILD